MSHELRTPLNAIIGFSEALADEALSRVKPERRADYAALIHRSGVHLLEVVNSILDMAKIESGSFAISPRACAIAPLVEQSLALMAMKADTAGVILATDFAPDAPEVDADPRAVTQVVLNLVANAIKFTPAGGVVTVALKAQRGGVGLTVRDTGMRRRAGTSRAAWRSVLPGRGWRGARGRRASVFRSCAASSRCMAAKCRSRARLGAAPRSRSIFRRRPAHLGRTPEFPILQPRR